MPPLNIPPLSAADCPLLAKYGGSEAEALVHRFNAALADIAKHENDRQIAPLLASERFREVFAPFEKAHGRMTEPRYVVGCIGLTQAGKSTTINNVLGEEVCKAGSGDATSSQPGRILYSDRRALDIEYLTPGRVTSRRQSLCDELGYSTPGSDAELLAALDQPDKFRNADGLEPPRLKEDLAYLKDFLKACRQHTHLLTDPAKILADQPYEKRYAYTTHAAGGTGTEVLLVREARFRIDNKQIPEDLELCDLPGLDSKRSIDDVVTWEYLPDLHGTFLFVNVGMNLLAKGTLTTLARIQKEFKGQLAGRAWLILNKMDTLTRDHFRTGGQDNIFATIDRLLEKTGIPPSQVCFCSKKIWDGVDKGSKSADPAFAAQTMSQTADTPVPETCPSSLRGAWNELLRDGGISHIRTLMFRDVALALAAQIRKDVAGWLDEFETNFARRVKTERTRLSLASTDLQAVMTCYNVIFHIQSELDPRKTLSQFLVQEGDHLRKSLGSIFDNNTAEVLANLPAAELPGLFRTHARVLDQQLRAEMAGDMLTRVYQVVGQGLDGLPPVPVGPSQLSCKDAWQRFGREDRDDEFWRAALPSFPSDDLVRWLSRPGADGADGGVYVDLMRDKIDVAVRQTVHMIRAQLRHRLGEIAGDLALLTGGRDAAPTP